jgi:TPR repeat protein
MARDAQQAMAWYCKAAERGNAHAQFSLGLRYDAGNGVLQDAAKAFSWYRRAAEQGHARAQFNLGTMYAEGHGTDADPVQAWAWLDLAAGHGMSQAARARTLFAQQMTAAQRNEAAAMSQQLQRKSAGESPA